MSQLRIFIKIEPSLGTSGMRKHICTEMLSVSGNIVGAVCYTMLCSIIIHFLSISLIADRVQIDTVLQQYDISAATGQLVHEMYLVFRTFLDSRHTRHGVDMTPVIVYLIDDSALRFHEALVDEI